MSPNKALLISVLAGAAIVGTAYGIGRYFHKAQPRITIEQMVDGADVYVKELSDDEIKALSEEDRLKELNEYRKELRLKMPVKFPGYKSLDDIALPPVNPDQHLFDTVVKATERGASPEQGHFCALYEQRKIFAYACRLGLCGPEDKEAWVSGIAFQIPEIDKQK